MPLDFSYFYRAWYIQFPDGLEQVKLPVGPVDLNQFFILKFNIPLVEKNASFWKLGKSNFGHIEPCYTPLMVNFVIYIPFQFPSCDQYLPSRDLLPFTVIIDCLLPVTIIAWPQTWPQGNNDLYDPGTSYHQTDLSRSSGQRARTLSLLIFEPWPKISSLLVSVFVSVSTVLGGFFLLLPKP